MSHATTSEEYHDLLKAQRVLSKSIDEPTEEMTEQARVALALLQVIREKRVMRGKPGTLTGRADLQAPGRKRKPDSGWIDPSAPPPSPPK